MSILNEKNGIHLSRLSDFVRNISGSLVNKKSGEEINLKLGRNYKKTDPQNSLFIDDKTDELSVKVVSGSLTTIPNKSLNLEHLDLEIKNIFRRY